MDVETLARIHRLWHSNAPRLYSCLMTWVLDTNTQFLQILKSRPTFAPGPAAASFSSPSSSVSAVEGSQYEHGQGGRCAPLSPPQHSSPGDSRAEERPLHSAVTMVYAVPDGVGIVEHGLPPYGSRTPGLLWRYGHTGPVRTALLCQCSPERALLAVRGDSRGVCLLDQGGETRSLDTEEDGWGLEFDGRSLVGNDRAGNVYVWDLGCEGAGPRRANVGAPVECLSLSTLARSMIVAGCGRGGVRVLDTRAAIETVSVIALDNYIYGISSSPFNQYYIASGCEDGKFYIHDLRNIKTPVMSQRAHSDSCMHISFSPNHRNLIVTGGDDARATIWDISVEDGKCLFVHAGHTAPITGLGFVHDRPLMIVTCAEDNTLMAWTPNIKII